MIRITESNLIFGYTAIFVINQTTLFPVVFEDNDEKTKKEKGILLPDRNRQSIHLFNTLKHTRIEFFPMNHLPLTL